MPKTKKAVIEYRNYDLPDIFPVLLLTGEQWRISDIPSGRLHFHNCMEIGVCESDAGTMEFMNDKIPFTKGDFTIVAGGVSHTTYSAPGTASKWSYLFVDVEALFQPFFLLHTIENGDSLTALLQNYSAVLSSEDYPEMAFLIQNIFREILGGGTNYQFSVRGLFLSLITKLLRLYMEETSLPGSHMHQNSMVIAPALNYIHTNYMQEFTIDHLAGLCHLSPTHFRRVFTSIMNSSPLEYLNHLRIQKASLLLRTSEMPILNISEEVGFRSLSSFNRHFLSDLSMTPTEYRKQISYIPNQSVQKYSGWMTPPK